MNLNKLVVDGYNLTTQDVKNVARNFGCRVVVSDKVKAKVNDSRRALDDMLEDGKVIYGVNTSMGGFVNWLVPLEYATELQNNLISAIATNVGEYLSDDIVRAGILSRINSLARGASAISLFNFKKIIALMNAGVIPLIPQKGSLGTSGDLGPLAYIALVCCGKWRAKYNQTIMSGEEVLRSIKQEPMKLSYKEGLSLVNGTSMMSGMGALLVEDVRNLIKTYDVVSSLSLEMLLAKLKPFDPIVHRAKPHKGQINTAKNIFTILENSRMVTNELKTEKELYRLLKDKPLAAEDQIEDAYSLRCSPQILGPIKDSINFVQCQIENELNSSNDNPLIFPNENKIFHNGHFHGQYVAMVMDYLSICLTTISNLSDRRIDRFLDKHHSNNLPAFLCKEKPGLRLGLMGGQFMSASLTAENRSLCTPVSIQTLPTTEDFQDVVSFGLVAARRVKEILKNTFYVIAFELICGCQAADIRGVEKMSKVTTEIYQLVRTKVPYFDYDFPLTDYIECVVKMIESGEIVSIAENIVGELLI